MNILFVSRGFDTEGWAAEFAAALPECNVTPWRPGDPAPKDAQLAIVWQPPAELFTQVPALRAIFNLGAGVDALLDAGTLADDVLVVRLEDAGMAVQMAEYCLVALLRQARDFDVYEQAADRAEWIDIAPLDRQQWPVGVLGLGVVGRKIAQTLADFGFPVAGWSRSGGAVPGVAVHAGQACLPAFLAGTRVLINALPLTDATRDILDRDTLGRLLPDSYLINVGRGQHLVEQDLLFVLEHGPLVGATLDVFRTEPLPAEHPFWRHPAVRVTPHIAARTLRREAIEQIAGKIRVYLNGGQPSGAIERGRGY